MFINLFRSEFAGGYERIKNARHWLLGKWRFEVLRAYRKRWDKFAQEVARREIRKVKFQRNLPWIMTTLILLCAGSLWITSVAFYAGIALIMALFAGFVVIISLWFYFNVKPKRLEHPLAQRKKDKYTSPLKQELFPDLVPLWKHQISERILSSYEIDGIVKKNKKWGLIGEYNLIRALNLILPPNTFILHSLMLKEKDDLDVVVIGPKGIWYFEVKYLNANIQWHNNQWAFYKRNHDTGQMESFDIGEDPDKQWYRMKSLAKSTLSSHGKELVARVPDLLKIKGGIVFAYPFAHPNENFDIQKSPPFRWGNIRGWVGEYQRAPMIKSFSNRTVFQALDILLARHQELNSNTPVISMKAQADKIIKETESKIQAWIEASEM